MGIFNRKSKEKDVEIRETNTTETQNNYPVPVGLSFLFDRTGGEPTSVSAYFAALEMISNTIATIPIHVRNVKDNEILYNHQINNIWNNGLQTKFLLIKQLVWDMLTTGNGMAYIKRANDGTPIEIVYLPSGSTSIIYNEANRQLYYLNAYVKKGKIEPINMIHFIKNTHDGVNGIGVSKYAHQILNLSKATNKTAENYFDSGCNLSGILTSDKTMGIQQKTEAKETWERIHGKYGSGGGIAVLGNDWKYQSIAANSEQSQMLQSREFNITELARYFTISPTLLGDLSHTQYGTLEAAQADFIAHTLLPLISMIQDELNRKLLKPSERGNIIIDLDEDHIYLSDKASTANYLTTLTSSGILSINEARHVLGYQPIEGGDEHIIPFTDISQNTIGGNEEDNTNKQE